MTHKRLYKKEYTDLLLGYLSIYEYGVYSYLKKLDGKYTKKVFPKISTISKFLEISEWKVKDCLKSLENKGVIIKGKMGKDLHKRTNLNSYTLVDFNDIPNDLIQESVNKILKGLNKKDEKNLNYSKNIFDKEINRLGNLYGLDLVTEDIKDGLCQYYLDDYLKNFIIDEKSFYIHLNNFIDIFSILGVENINKKFLENLHSKLLSNFSNETNTQINDELEIIITIFNNRLNDEDKAGKILNKKSYFLKLINDMEKTKTLNYEYATYRNKKAFKSISLQKYR